MKGVEIRTKNRTDNMTIRVPYGSYLFLRRLPFPFLSHPSFRLPFTSSVSRLVSLTTVRRVWNEDGKRQDEVDRKDVNGKRLRQEGESRGY